MIKFNKKKANIKSDELRRLQKKSEAVFELAFFDHGVVGKLLVFICHRSLSESF